MINPHLDNYSKISEEESLHIPLELGNNRSVIWNSEANNDLTTLSSSDNNDSNDNDEALLEIENLSQYFISSQSEKVDKTSNTLSLSNLLSNVYTSSSQRTPKRNKPKISNDHIYERIQDFIKRGLNKADDKSSCTNMFELEEDLDFNYIEELEENYLKSKQTESSKSNDLDKKTIEISHSDDITDITQWLYENDLDEFYLPSSNKDGNQPR